MDYFPWAQCFGYFLSARMHSARVSWSAWPQSTTVYYHNGYHVIGKSLQSSNTKNINVEQLIKSIVRISKVKGYEMSARQLDLIWQYESFLAHHLLDMPVRKCSAKPNENWGSEMSSEEFQKLKSELRKMWCRACQYFEAFKCEGDAGWGLRPRSDLGKKL